MQHATFTHDRSGGRDSGAAPGLLLQRKCACGNQTIGGAECAKCRSKEGMLQRRRSHDVDVSAARPLASFPHEAQIQQAFGAPIIGKAVVDPSECARRRVPAFTDHHIAHFASERPSLRVAAHEAAHLAQHGGITHDRNLGAEQHANSIASRIAGGQSIAALIGRTGSAITPALRPYTDISVASQTATEWDAKMPLRVAEDGRMAVGQDGTMHSFWADSGLIAQSNTTLASKKSVIRLNELGDKLTGKAPDGTTTKTLSKVSPKNVANATTGENMNLWADCGKSGRDVMGAGEGTGKNYDKMAAVYRAPQKPPLILQYLGFLPFILSGTPPVVDQQTGASSPEEMKKEIFNEKLGGSGDEGLNKYKALPSAEKDKFDRETGINRYAAPKTGEGYTMSTGGARIPGKSTWNFHWAGVVMTSGDNRVALENYAVGDASVQNSDWEFQMYGSAAKLGQTFHEQHRATGQHGDAPTSMRVTKR